MLTYALLIQIRVVTERKNILTSLSRSNQSGPVVPLLVIAPLSVLQFLKVIDCTDLHITIKLTSQDFAVVDPAISDAYIPVCNKYAVVILSFLNPLYIAVDC